MSTPLIRGSRSATDTSMVGAVDFPRPQTWDEIVQLSVGTAGPAPIHLEECPEWLCSMIEQLKVNENDIRSLTEILNREGSQIKGDLNQVKAHYQSLVNHMQSAYDLVCQQGDINRVWSEKAIIYIIGASHEFGREVWKMIADAETEATKRQQAQEEANRRAEEGNKVISPRLHDWASRQQAWNVECEQEFAELKTKENKLAIQVQAMAKH
jgi:hypothetical protein